MSLICSISKGFFLAVLFFLGFIALLHGLSLIQPLEIATLKILKSDEYIACTYESL